MRRCRAPTSVPRPPTRVRSRRRRTRPRSRARRVCLVMLRMKYTPVGALDRDERLDQRAEIAHDQAETAALLDEGKVVRRFKTAAADGRDGHGAGDRGAGGRRRGRRRAARRPGQARSRLHDAVVGSREVNARGLTGAGQTSPCSTRASTATTRSWPAVSWTRRASAAAQRCASATGPGSRATARSAAASTARTSRASRPAPTDRRGPSWRGSGRDIMAINVFHRVNESWPFFNQCDPTRARASRPGTATSSPGSSTW